MADAIPVDLSDYGAEGILTDGSSIHIRAIRPDDRDRLLDHFHRLSPESVYFRFLGIKPSLSEAELDRFTRLDYVRNFALAAILRGPEGERIIGVGRYVAAARDSEPPRRGEVAFAVDDNYQGRGIGTLLLEHLSRVAYANGIDRLDATVMASNTRMLEVFSRSGFELRQSLEAGVVQVSFSSHETEQFLSRSLYRERLAASLSVARILRPGSVAVVGASREPHKIGGAIVANLMRTGFKGKIYPVNPKVSEVQGLRAYPSLAAIEAPVDLAVISVPAAAVMDVVRECAAARVHGLVVISSGFAEMAGSGVAAQQELAEFVRSSGMRMIGPNCMGIINTDPNISLNATFAPIAPVPGNVAMLSQSGALGIAILDQVRLRGIGLSSFVSVGNRADVSSNDLLAYWTEDPRTSLIVLYLESFGNPRKFARFAASAASRKPVVAVKSGRSRAGRRAALSHSASLASRDAAVDALFEQCGVIRTDTLEQLFDVSALFSTQPVPKGPKIGVVTNAGGPAILLADACEARKLPLPELGKETQARLREILSARAAFSNPVDMTAAATAEDYEHAISAVGNDPEIDSLIVIYIPPLVTDPQSIAQGIARGAARVPADKPILAAFLSSEPPPEELHRGPRGRLPCYSFPENAAIALEAAWRYARWKSRPRGSITSLDPAINTAIRELVDPRLAGMREPQWIEPGEVDAILAAAGIKTAPARQTDPQQARAVAEEMGFPLVAKIISRDVVHKSDVGGVIMGLGSGEEVAAAVDTLGERMRSLGKRLDGILLQRQLAGGIEALVGITEDPTFGKVMVAGMGGVAVEIIKDVAFRVLPVTDIDAAAMVAELRSSRLLDGFRGNPPGDRAALVDLIGRVSALAEAIPELVDMDLNPVRIMAPGAGVVALDARIRLDPAARLRHARESR